MILILLITLLAILVYVFCFSPKSQKFGKVVYSGNQTSEKLVTLSFDDGPNDPYTSKILEILGSYNVQATFFLVGENINRQADTVKKIFDQGHVIGNHSYRHSFLAPIVSPYFEEEISRTQGLIYKLIGKHPALFRPPWFFRQPFMLQTARQVGLSTITGTFGSALEVFQPSAEAMAHAAFKKVKPGTILVFHDGYNSTTANREQTVKAMAILIPQLIQEGYKFVTIPELLGIPSYQ